MKNDESPLRVKSTNFAVRIINLSRDLMENRKEYILSKQIVRSATNPGAMIREAARAESGLDFIHKLSIGLKEIEETNYWLELLVRTNYISKADYGSICKDSDEIVRMLTSSILTKKKNLKK